MKTLKEFLDSLPPEEQKDFLEGIFEMLRTTPEQQKKLISLNSSQKELFKQKFISKLLSCSIDDENLKK